MVAKVFYTVEIKENGNWIFYKRTPDKSVADSIKKAFGNLCRISITTYYKDKV